MKFLTVFTAVLATVVMVAPAHGATLSGEVTSQEGATLQSAETKFIDGDPDRPVITGTKEATTGIEHEDIGVTDSPDSGEKSIFQNNQSDLEFIGKRVEDASGTEGEAGDDSLSGSSSVISSIVVDAVHVRGWDPEKKEEVLKSIKEAVEVRSDQDLEHFAQGVLLNDENVVSVQVDEKKVEVKYREPAKLFGFISSSLVAKASVDAEGRVKVKFPWYRFLFSLKKDVQAASLEAAISTETQAALNLQSAVARQAQYLQMVSNIMKTRHDTAKSVIQNIR
jgi:hypothetical protein